MDLVWTLSARKDRREIFEFIQEDSVRAASKMDTIFRQKAALLTRFPELGRPGRVPETRELLAHRHYFIIYRIRGNQIEILRLLHTSRQWPPSSSHKL
jgi:addiction module RelE/StbE family toxin